MAKFKVGDRVRWTGGLKSRGEETIVGLDHQGDPVLSKSGNFYWVTVEENCELANNSSSFMSNIKSVYRALKRSEPEKSFVKAGVMNDSEELTTEGKELFIDFLFEKHKAEFKTDVVDPILAEQEKKS